MSVTVAIPTPLRKLTAGAEEVTVAGKTIGELLVDLESKFPGMKERLCDDSGQVRRFVNIFVSDEDQPGRWSTASTSASAVSASGTTLVRMRAGTDAHPSRARRIYCSVRAQRSHHRGAPEPAGAENTPW